MVTIVMMMIDAVFSDVGIEQLFGRLNNLQRSLNDISNITQL